MFRKDKHDYVPYIAQTPSREEARLTRKTKNSCPKFTMTKRALLKDQQVANKLIFPILTNKILGYHINAWCDFHQAKGYDIDNCHTLSRKED